MQVAGDRWVGAISILVLLSVMLCPLSPCWGQSDLLPQAAPVNPEFAGYLEQAAYQSFTGDGHGLGFVPPPVRLPDVKGIDQRQALSLPASYDLRTTGKLTSVRNQGGCGSCWAFATFGSMESCLMPGESRDFSENNLKNLSGFDYTCCQGGHQFMAAAYLSRWGGPVNEINDPYNSSSCTSPTGLTVQKHVQQIILLPDRASLTDNDAIKQAVMTHGAVYTSFWWTDSSYNSSTYSYYYTGSSSNHAVCIVGWDDNYDKTRFLTQPPANGAFIVRNSWGSGWGQGGYFYVSYYDTTFGKNNAVFAGNSPVTEYDRIFQYDPLGWTGNVGYGTTTAWGANIFTASQSGPVSAFSFYASTPGTSYDARIYLNPNNGPIRSTGYVARETGTVADSGYYTVPIATLVQVNAGDRFSVVIKFTTPGMNYPIPMEQPIGGYSSAATAGSGQSYISSTGSTWTDITKNFKDTNVCIKAFGASPGITVTSSGDLSAAGPVGGPMQYGAYTAAYTVTNTGASSVTWSASGSESWVSLSPTGGTLAGGASAQVVASVSSLANSLPAGEYSALVSFTNTTSGIGNTTRSAALTVRDARLAIDPSDGFDSFGASEGPFTPASKTYTITNTGYSNLYWSAVPSEPWVSGSPSSGILQPQQQAQVSISINSGAVGLPIGVHSAEVAFANNTNGDGNTSRAVNLTISGNYTLLPTAFNWVDPSSHLAVPLTDNGISGAQSLPFAFTFYGQQYTMLYIGANGLIGFSDTTGLDAYVNGDIPGTGFPNGALYPWWDDLNPSSTGSVRIGTAGTAPNRRYVISWVGVPHRLSPSLPVTLQVLLHETSGDITFQYQEVQAGDIEVGAGRSATIGIEDPTGRLAGKYSYNGSALLSNNQAMLFTMNPPVPIPAAKSMPNGVLARVSDAVVTGVFSSLFYIGAEDRSGAIAVYKSSHGLTPGMRVDVSGTISTNVDGEKYIAATSAVQTGSGTVDPMMLLNREVGGADSGYDSATGAGQKGVRDAISLNNIGMLVCTTGKVTYVGTNFFYLDDGSGARDITAYKGVKATVSGQTLPALNQYVRVCGISSCYQSGSDLYRMIRVRSIAVQSP